MPKMAGPEHGSDTQLTHFIVVVLAVENLPLLRAFENDLALRGDLESGSGVDSSLLCEERLKSLARLLADRVAIFIESHLVDIGQRVGNRMGQLVELVAADPHSTALYFLANSVFTFLNISAYCAPDLRISSEYASRITRTSSLMRSSSASSSIRPSVTRASVPFKSLVVISLASMRCLTVRRARYPMYSREKIMG